MGGDSLLALASLGLILANAFFVAAEYALVSSRKSRLEGLARRGDRRAKRLVAAMADVSPYVAGVQIAITMIGVGIGLVAEPFITNVFEGLIRLIAGRDVSGVAERGLSLLSIVVITFLTVVFGELVPKYLTLRRPEGVAFVTFPVLRVFVTALRPLVMLVQGTGALVLRLLGVRPDEAPDVMAKEELLMLVRTGGAEGVLDKTHAELVTRALRLDVLAARDIMVHRLDIKWLDVSLTRDALLERLRDIPYSRVPVCRGDIDDMVGIVYLHDVVKHLHDPDLKLERIVRPLVAIPENLTMERIVQTMREEKIQMLVVMDEYGGTSGIITLEDVVEEVFGELEDRLESERPQVEVFPGGRISARADVRIDELVSRLGLNVDVGDNTDTLATLVVEGLERVPRPGDSVQTDLGVLRVENMARRRITRVSLQLAPAVRAGNEPAEA